MHLMFFTLENQKLGNNAFDNEFLAQLILMSLPQDNTNWNTVTIILLQFMSDTKKLKTSDSCRSTAVSPVLSPLTLLLPCTLVKHQNQPN